MRPLVNAVVAAAAAAAVVVVVATLQGLATLIGIRVRIIVISG